MRYTIRFGLLCLGLLASWQLLIWSPVLLHAYLEVIR